MIGKQIFRQKIKHYLWENDVILGTRETILQSLPCKWSASVVLK